MSRVRRVTRSWHVVLPALVVLAACAGPRAAGETAAPLRIAVLSDLNSAYGSTSYETEVGAAVARVADEWRPDLVLIAGDMIAGQRPSLTDDNVRAMWAAFDSVVAAPLRAAGIPLAFTLGNHDASGHPSHGRDRRLAAAYWRDAAHVPDVAFTDSADYPFRWAFRAGDVFVLAACAGPRAAGDTATPLRIAVLSDLNSAYGSTSYDAEVGAAVARVADEWRPDLVLIAGDMIAGQRPSLTDDNVRAMWAAFDSVVAAPLRAAGIPLAFTLGNHDASGHPTHGRDRRLAAAYWRDAAHVPDVAFTDSTDYPFRWAFRAGDVFVLVLEASTGGVAADTSQLAWMERVLASEPARTAHTRIALGHVPLYAVAQGRNRPGEVQAEPDSVRRVLQRGGVAMYIAGHHHAYFPGRRDGLLLLSTGALGQGPRQLLGSDEAPYKAMTLLEMHAFGEIVDRTFRVDGAGSLVPVDRDALPARIDGMNGHVLRR